MIILTFIEGVLDINIVNTSIVCIAITVITTVIGLGIAGIGALIWAVITG